LNLGFPALPAGGSVKPDYASKFHFLSKALICNGFGKRTLKMQGVNVKEDVKISK
jgi:hypothetical protein